MLICFRISNLDNSLFDINNSNLLKTFGCVYFVYLQIQYYVSTKLYNKYLSIRRTNKINKFVIFPLIFSGPILFNITFYVSKMSNALEPKLVGTQPLFTDKNVPKKEVR